MEVVDPQQAEQAAEPLEKIGSVLAQVSRLPAAPRVASQGQYTGYGIAGFDGRDYVGAGDRRR